LKVREDTTFNKDYLQDKYGAILIFDYDDIINKYINSARWQNAHSYQKTTPHEYTILQWNKDLEHTFVEFVLHIRACGKTEKFYKITFKYLYHGKHKYCKNNKNMVLY